MIKNGNENGHRHKQMIVPVIAGDDSPSSRQDNMEAVRQVTGAPETIQPFGLVACGYPDKPVVPANRYDPSRIHYEKW